MDLSLTEVEDLISAVETQIRDTEKHMKVSDDPTILAIATSRLIRLDALKKRLTGL